MIRYFRLKGRTVEECTQEEWADRHRNRDTRIIAQERIGDYFLSTVFLGMDHGYGIGQPVLFETMVFAKNDDFEDFEDYQDRYCTYEEAEAGHEAAVQWVYRRIFTEEIEGKEIDCL